MPSHYSQGPNRKNLRFVKGRNRFRTVSCVFDKASGLISLFVTIWIIPCVTGCGQAVCFSRSRQRANPANDPSEHWRAGCEFLLAPAAGRGPEPVFSGLQIFTIALIEVADRRIAGYLSLIDEAGTYLLRQVSQVMRFATCCCEWICAGVDNGSR